MQVRQLDGRGAAFYGLHMVLLYAFVGVVLTALALLVYEKRHLETAGDVVTVHKSLRRIGKAWSIPTERLL